MGDCGEQRRPDWERCKTNQTKSKPTVFADIYRVKHLAADCVVPHLGETWFHVLGDPALSDNVQPTQQAVSPEQQPLPLHPCR